MSGLSRFDFYPRDWISGTRGLSDRARGVYIDLLCRIYDLGRALDYDERELCRFLGYRDHRQLRPALDELLAKEKIVIADGKLINPRAMREIDAAMERIETGKRGGRPRKQKVAQPANRDEIGTRSAPEGDQLASSSRSQGSLFEQNQYVDCNAPSPSPPPPIDIPPTEGAEAPISVDRKKEIYDLGKSILGPSGGGQVTKLIKRHADDLDAVERTLRLAATKSGPAEYIGAILRGTVEPPAPDILAETQELYRRWGVR